MRQTKHAFLLPTLPAPITTHRLRRLPSENLSVLYVISLPIRDDVNVKRVQVSHMDA